MDTDRLKNFQDTSDEAAQGAAAGSAPENFGAAGFAYANVAGGSAASGGSPLSGAPIEERGGANVVVREVAYEKPADGAQGVSEIRVKFDPVRIVVAFDASGAQRRFASEVARAVNEISAAVDGIVKNAIAGLDRRASVRGTV